MPRCKVINWICRLVQLHDGPKKARGFMVLELENLRFGTELLKRGFAKMQKGGVIMDVTTPAQAAIAEDAGAVAVMALHRSRGHQTDGRRGQDD